MRLQPYNAVPIINTLVSSFLQRASFVKEQVMLSAILNNYFSRADGFHTAFSSELLHTLPPYFHVRRMNQISGELEY